MEHILKAAICVGAAALAFVGVAALNRQAEADKEIADLWGEVRKDSPKANAD